MVSCCRFLVSTILVALLGGGAAALLAAQERAIQVTKFWRGGGGVTVPTSLNKPADCVVLLHGLGKSSRSMWWLQQQLSADYRVINQSYPSLSQPIEQLSEATVSAAISQCQGDQYRQIHFVTHSMGGILLRHYLSEHKIENLGRVVMLGPPNQGSEVIDHLADVPRVLALLGPAARQLTTQGAGITHSLGAVNYEVGVIAGDRSINPLLSRWLPGSDDGKVSIERTKVAGMQDFIVVPVSHPMLMWRPMVVEQVKHFLARGQFSALLEG
ncbi:alpha/beta fold hydrolase [Corallincola spongiicola]|uniref:Alpha/beta fold hydrolase n=1 Tax=Corallincola spongiicola TaxID=2520508 RepID=A0ABY1WQG1_9GAMM|nr:alpha/beta fold hydrolase [Corallincola spongiicola]